MAIHPRYGYESNDRSQGRVYREDYSGRLLSKGVRIDGNDNDGRTTRFDAVEGIDAAKAKLAAFAPNAVHLLNDAEIVELAEKLERRHEAQRGLTDKAAIEATKQDAVVDARADHVEAETRRRQRDAWKQPLGMSKDVR